METDAFAPAQNNRGAGPSCQTGEVALHAQQHASGFAAPAIVQPGHAPLGGVVVFCSRVRYPIPSPIPIVTPEFLPRRRPFPSSFRCLPLRFLLHQTSTLRPNPRNKTRPWIYPSPPFRKIRTGVFRVFAPNPSAARLSPLA